MIYGELSERLSSVAQLVRQGARLADIGTDHAYLPIFLLRQGRISHAFCSDINEGPLNSARRNAADAGVSDKITFTLADGADALAGLDVTDYAICGMGGELIADIIERAPDMRRDGVRLILQPMTRHAHLRRYLAWSGFDIECESFVRDSGKLYVCLLVKYSGICRDISDEEAELGLENSEIVNVGLQIEYLKEKKRAFSKIADGKIRGGDDAPPELSLAELAQRRIDEIHRLISVLPTE